MKKITQKLLELLVPREIMNNFKLEGIIESEEFVELIMRETSNLPKEVKGFQVEIMRYETTEILSYPIKGKQCRITLKRKRWKIKETGKTATNPIPGKIYGAKITEEFAKLLKELIEAQVTDIPRIARIMRVNSKTLRSWYQKILTDMEELAVENMVVVENVGKRLKIDEVCLHRGDFWTILSNAETKKACAIMKGTKVAELRKYIEKIPRKKRYEVEEITLDMSQSFDWLTREYFPNAEKVVDRFHVQQLVAKAVQEMRLRERRKYLRGEIKESEERFENGDTVRQLLARSRGLLFKVEKKWTERQKERAVILFREYPAIKKAYELSQDLKAWYNRKNGIKKSRERLKIWYKAVEESGLNPMIDAAESIRNHEGRICNYFRERSTNAFAESLNSKIKLFKTLVRGINKPKFFIYRLSRYIT